MLAVTLLLIGAAAAPDLPAGLPVFCYDKAGRYQPMNGVTYARLKAAFRHNFDFSANLVQSTLQSGTLTFYGPGRNPETIKYRVRPYDGGVKGIALLSMTVRLRGKSDDLRGDDMCWQTWSILTTR